MSSPTVHTGVMQPAPVLYVVQGNFGVAPVDTYGCKSQTPPVPALGEAFIPDWRRHDPDREV